MNGFRKKQFREMQEDLIKRRLLNFFNLLGFRACIQSMKMKAKRTFQPKSPQLLLLLDVMEFHSFLILFPNQIYRYGDKIFNRCEVNVTDVFSAFFLLLLNIRTQLFQSLFSNKRVLLTYLSFFFLSSRLQPDYHMIIQHLTKRKND